MFAYAPDLLEAYPNVTAGVLHATGLTNTASPAPLLEDYRSAQTDRLAALSATPIAELPSIAAWRRAFTRFGAKPTQYRNAAEALLRRLSKDGDVPTINTLVDIGNLVSVRWAMPVAVMDQAQVAGSTTVRFATGEESFTDLGSSETAHPEPGEVVFVDDAGVVSARRWCWRQSRQSASGPDTTDALIVIEGLHEDSAAEIGSALEDLDRLLTNHQPGAAWASVMLSSRCPSARFE